MLYRDLYQQALRATPLPDAPLEIQLLLERAFGLPRHHYWRISGESVASTAGVRRFRRWLARLQAHEPLAYILGEREFYSAVFQVDPHTLIPRPETEILVETVLQAMPRGAEILDIGAGSGNIAIMLARHGGHRVTALECSPGALRVLRANIRRLDATALVRAVRGDLFPRRRQLFSAIVSNPPYLTEAEWGELPPHIREFEPATALRAGEDGLDVIRAIAAGAAERLSPAGRLFLEIGAGQHEAVAELLAEHGWREIAFAADLAGIPRVASARR